MALAATGAGSSVGAWWSTTWGVPPSKLASVEAVTEASPSSNVVLGGTPRANLRAMREVEFQCPNCDRLYEDLRRSTELEDPYLCPSCKIECVHLRFPTQPPAAIRRSGRRGRAPAPESPDTTATPSYGKIVMENCSATGCKHGLVMRASTNLEGRNLSFDGCQVPIKIVP